jgi:hypothetical protein
LFEGEVLGALDAFDALPREFFELECASAVQAASCFSSSAHRANWMWRVVRERFDAHTAWTEGVRVLLSQLTEGDACVLSVLQRLASSANGPPRPAVRDLFFQAWQDAARGESHERLAEIASVAVNVAFALSPDLLRAVLDSRELRERTGLEQIRPWPLDVEYLFGLVAGEP